MVVLYIDYEITNNKGKIKLYKSMLIDVNIKTYVNIRK